MTHISESCKTVIKELVTSGKIGYTSSYPTLSIGDVEHALLPNFLIWDPMQQYQNLTCPFCDADKIKEKLSLTKEWEMASSKGRIPRTIWTHGWVCLLIGRIYSCTYGHHLNSYHPGILKQMKIEEIPFILGQRSGFDCELFNTILIYIMNGLTFLKIETILEMVYVSNFEERISSLDFQEQEKARSMFRSCTPSNDSIKQCLMNHVEIYKHRYEQFFKDISYTNLCVDHTFKSATNVGQFVDGKWQKLKDSLFFALTEKGQIKSFEFTKGTGFDQVEQELSQLKIPKLIALDNCCQWENKLASVYPGTIIKLDLFHAIKRVTDEVSKKHIFQSAFSKDFAMTFRSGGDNGSERLLETPSPSVIFNNIKRFLERWAGVNHNGWFILSPKVIKSIDNLKTHVLKGCLSNIPPGFGTNRNERLHRELNNMLRRNRLSLPVAKAIVTLIAFRYNQKSREKDIETIVRPIWSILTHIPLSHVTTTTNKENSVKIRSTDVFSYLVAESYSDVTSDHDYAISSTDVQVSQILQFCDKISQLMSIVPKDMKSRLYIHAKYPTMPSSLWNCTEYLMMCDKFLKLTDMEKVIEEMGLSKVDSYGDNLYTIIGNILKDQNIENFEELLKTEISENDREYQSLDFDISTIEEKCFLEIAANSVGAIIFIVPGCQTMPMYMVLPRDIKLKRSITIHYLDQKFYFLETNPERQKSIAIRCLCGSKDKTEKKRCLPSFRCYCARNKLKCTSLCKCKGCTNGKPTTEKRFQRKKSPTALSHSASMISEDVGLSSEDEISGKQHIILDYIVFMYSRNEKIPVDHFDEDDINYIYDTFSTYSRTLADKDASLQALFQVPKKIKVQSWYTSRKNQQKLLYQLTNFK